MIPFKSIGKFREVFEKIGIYTIKVSEVIVSFGDELCKK